MLTLTQLNQRIEALETEEFSAINTRLDTWYAMVSWQFFVAQYDDAETAKKALHSLSNDHPMRIAVGKLMWFMHYFADVLPNNVTWRNEKAELCFAAWIEQGIEENYTESALCSEVAMNDALQFVATCLTNGALDFYDKRKKEEQEFWELQQTYRRQAHEGRLSEEAEEWLRINDSAFLENLNAKKQSEVKPAEVKPITTEAIPPALPEILPETTKPKSDNFVLAHWAGLDENWLTPTADGVLPVFRNREYRLSLQTWQNIESDSYLRQRWHRISNE